MQIFDRKTKENKPVLAICYDFDKTLSPDDMQAQGFIQANGYDVKEFWEDSNSMASQNEMDQNLSWMYKMLKTSYGKTLFTKDTLRDFGSKVALFEGVEEWFDRINEYASKQGVIVEHYIISSGLKEMIEGTKIAKYFTKIYASSFLYDNANVAIWPAQVINYTTKTQFLYRIEKGIIDINDPAVNDYLEESKKRIPFKNIVYIGDSDTDIPCMKLVNSKGGYSIGVYNPSNQNKDKVYKMMREKRIGYFAQADYSEGSEIDKLLKAIILKTAANEELDKIHLNCYDEFAEADKKSSEEEKIKKSLIISLESSSSFAETHMIIAEMNKYKWNREESKTILNIANENSQVSYIVNDNDVRTFLKKITSSLDK